MQSFYLLFQTKQRPGSFISHFFVQSSTAAGNGADGIVVDDEFAHDDVTKLTKNAVIGNHLDGIDLVGVPAAAVSGNLIAGNGAIGIEVSQSNGILATKNRVLGNTGDGITIDANSASALIKGNTVVGNGNTGGTVHHGCQS